MRFRHGQGPKFLTATLCPWFTSRQLLRRIDDIKPIFGHGSARGDPSHPIRHTLEGDWLWASLGVSHTAPAATRNARRFITGARQLRLQSRAKGLVGDHDGSREAGLGVEEEDAVRRLAVRVAVKHRARPIPPRMGADPRRFRKSRGDTFSQWSGGIACALGSDDGSFPTRALRASTPNS
jgi:hypothetical protein